MGNNPINHIDPLALFKFRYPDLFKILKYLGCMIKCILRDLNRTPYGPLDLANDPLTFFNALVYLPGIIRDCDEECRPPCFSSEVEISLPHPSPQQQAAMTAVIITVAIITVMIVLAPVLI